jgi:hypothetical protein
MEFATRVSDNVFVRPGDDGIVCVDIKGSDGDEVTLTIRPDALLPFMMALANAASTDAKAAMKAELAERRTVRGVA